MNITVLTPDKEIFRGPVKSVKVPGVLGQFQVLNNHAPIVSALEEGKVTMVTSDGEFQFYNQESGELEPGNTAGKEISYVITKGFIEVLNNEISLLIEGV